MIIPFAKYQALGNSFIVPDRVVPRGRLKKFERLAQKICDPVYGVGANGLMIVSGKGRNRRADVYNSDGSWAEKSGNGIRIAAMHLLNTEKISGRRVNLGTGCGASRIEFHSGNRHKRIISASLGSPVFEAMRIPVESKRKDFINQPVKAAGKILAASAVSIGNPHLIIFCDHFDFDWQAIGRELEIDPIFPNRINVGFVIVRNKKKIEVRDWERGAGPTESSGTGAAAAVAIAAKRGLTGRRVDVRTLAGTLMVSWDDKSDEMIIKGPVEFICSGRFRYR